MTGPASQYWILNLLSRNNLGLRKTLVTPGRRPSNVKGLRIGTTDLFTLNELGRLEKISE
jgi:hypothetical protein